MRLHYTHRGHSHKGRTRSPLRRLREGTQREGWREKEEIEDKGERAGMERGGEERKTLTICTHHKCTFIIVFIIKITL